MAVFEHLAKVLDQRKECNDCDFNGYLEDFLSIQEDFKYHDLFQALLDINSEFRICVGLGFNVNKEVISNQIIRYKDASKLPDKAMRCPYIIYLSTDDYQKAVIFGEEKQYLLAKGYYYCLTEQYAMLEDSRNEIIALSLDNPTLITDKVQKFLLKDSRAGAVQREIDSYYFHNIHELIDIAFNSASDLRDQAKETLLTMEDRADYIYQTITKWYLLKKVVYVSYMMNKDVLRDECENEIKKQRYNAKINSDKIPFMALSEMWRFKAEEPAETPAE
ncbi:MAG: hypothetical protein VB012_04585 [Erysipelotrichaceae bacterium]|nr:hypothetical protein [Erysipelotrichaceae bacterium]